ncbi:MAG: hypothetical protein KDB03_23975 [Planctomycetales bacterium]|nr:hypothetical protein [Planctomycetales bacterium]
MQRIIFFLCLIVCYSSSITPVSGHPFHTSLAELEFNPMTGNFEISMKLHAADLEQALSRIGKQTVSLETSSEVDQRIADYLKQHFGFLEPENLPGKTHAKLLDDSDDDGTPAGASRNPKLSGKIVWHGKEMDGAWIWLYFEIGEVEQRTEPLRFVNQVLLSDTQNQINTVVIRCGPQKTAYRTSLSNPTIELTRSQLGLDARKNQK